MTKGTRFKDFGQGFYVTPDFATAERMARKKVSLLKGVPTIISYEFDDSALTSDEVKVHIFPQKATVEWIHFIEKKPQQAKNS